MLPRVLAQILISVQCCGTFKNSYKLLFKNTLHHFSIFSQNNKGVHVVNLTQTWMYLKREITVEGLPPSHWPVDMSVGYYF